MNTRLFESKDSAEVTLQKKLFELGLKVDLKTGHLSYADHFTPLKSNFQLVFIRHGATPGNEGQATSDAKLDHELISKGKKDHKNRIFQGNVDCDINQLSKFGIEQADAVALQLEEELLANNWRPDVVLYSPLTRAQATALPFIERNKLETCSYRLDDIREMSFGSSDNRRVCDLDENHPWHSFYRDQNALVKESGINGNGIFQEAENFVEVLFRAHNVLKTLEIKYPDKKIIMFSHSMFGAACNILYGHGRRYDNENYLAFDGKDKNGVHYVMPNAKPILLNFEPPARVLLKP